MIKNYLKVAFRNLVKQRFYTIINILGLSIGLTACLIITLFVVDELSYDRYHEKADRTYRVNAHFSLGGQEGHYAVAPAPLAMTMVETYPEIENAVRFRNRGSYTIYREENTYKENQIIFADATLFNVFTIPLRYGDPQTALSQPHTMVISRAAAQKYFGNNWESDPPLGEHLLVGLDKVSYQVTGIFDKIPDNSHFHFDVFLSMASLDESKEEVWLSNNFYTYLLLREGTDVNSLQSKLNETFERYAAPQIKQYAGLSIEEFKQSGNKFEYELFPLTDIHLQSDLDAEMEANSDVRYVYIFSAIAFFILLIACVNFMNLATARSSGRAKEVGVRKVLGSQRKQLIGQFLVEAIMICFVSLAIALIATEVLLPFFNDLANKQLHLSYIESWYIIPALIVIVCLVGLLAGSYPAFFLSAFRPIVVLKGNLATGMKNNWLRSTLVVLQFGISIILIVSTVVVYQQLNLIQNKKLGYDKEHVLVLQNTYYLDTQVEAFKNEALRHPNIVHASVSAYLPASSLDISNNSIFPDKNPQSEYITSLSWYYIDHDYIKTMGMEIVEGRDFSRAFATDSSAMIINEAAAEYFEFYKDGGSPIGKILSQFGEDDNPTDFSTYKVIGVVKDFNYATMRQKIMPMVMVLGQSTGAISFKIKPEEMQGTIAFLEKTWNAFAPGVPFEYSFMDDRFNRMYTAEQKVGNIFTIFCSLAILIACLGLFGLASYTAEQRTKEIGIRKVMGASVWSVVMMFSKGFTKLVIIALLIAIPISYYAMNQWLDDFAYRIDIGPTTFLIAGVIALLVAWITVSFQSFKAATANPVKSLRSE